MEVTYMAINIFDKYGIKEVANVYFQALQNEPEANIYEGDIVLYLDTLKVSTIEQTAEQSDARGGWSNPKLITWDYNKEITVTLEDALMSLESLRFMMGGKVIASKANQAVLVRHTEEVVADNDGNLPLPKDHITNEYLIPKATAGHPIKLINLGGGKVADGHDSVQGARTQIQYSTASGAVNQFNSGTDYAGKTTVTFKNDTMLGTIVDTPAPGDRIRIFWEEEVVTDDAAVEVTISPSTFPGTYRIVGDTLMRSQKTGKDEAFQFVINKAKVSSEVTLTLEAEGDPSTFSMTLTVLRDANERGDQEMMKLIRYGGAAADASTTGDDNGSLQNKSE